MPDLTISDQGNREVYTAKQRHRLRRIERFLSNVAEPSIGALAARHGYDGDEHRYGWQQYGVAAGMDRPFDHYLSEAERKALLGASSVTIERYRVLDEFENTWFPRARNAILRYLPAGQREVFAAAFFKDLAQQPQGPLVVGSVELFLTRLAAMQQDRTPGAAEAHVALVKKGLSQDLLERIRGLLAAAKTEATPAAPSRVSEADIAKATARQLDAYERLNLWYNDWADTLRTELSYRQLIRLGLIAVRGGRQTIAEEDDPDGDEDEGLATPGNPPAPVAGPR